MLDLTQSKTEDKDAWDISTECSGLANALGILTEHVDITVPRQRGAVYSVLWLLKERSASLSEAVETHPLRNDTFQPAAQLVGLVDAALSVDADAETQGMTTMRSLASLAVDITDNLMTTLDVPGGA